MNSGKRGVISSNSGNDEKEVRNGPDEKLLCKPLGNHRASGLPVHRLHHEKPRIRRRLGMNTIVDARGLSCPQPFLMTMDEIKKGSKGEIEVLVDTDTSKENVIRAAQSQGWQVKDVQEEGEGYRITIVRS